MRTKGHLTFLGDRLYVGTATGAVQVYTYAAGGGIEGLPKVTWVKTHNLARRQIDQIGVLPNSGHLLVLSGMCPDASSVGSSEDHS